MSDWRSNSRKKRHKIWLPSLEELQKVIKNSVVLSDTLKYFGIDTSSSSYRALRERLRLENVDCSHIPLGLSANRGRPPRHKTAQPPLDEVLIEHSSYSRKALKNRLIKEGLLLYQCYECKIGSEWNNKPLSLQLDHINGISNDNRIENLRLLCPNCHSQTSTYAGRNNK